MNLLLLCLGLLPPSRLKNRLLSLTPGWKVAPDARFGPCVVWGVPRFVVGAGAKIGTGNVFRRVRSVVLGERSIVGQFNWFTAAAEGIDIDNAGRRRGTLVLARGAGFTSRHYVDASGGVELGEFSIIGGLRTTVLSHSLDPQLDAQMIAPVVLGAHCLVLTNCTLLPGTELADRVVLASNSMVRGSLAENETLYAGTPARAVSAMPGGRFFDRS